ncbi:predicted protein [Nematostella vectensis]|uniref:Uncharacterized protein n=1 Tax=Nematostella vectensis TaxID=45351 RepID=A7RMB8_NEMVE|nr:predicted protein [Nematostella vectensis]|eukprot:XP_001639637.1 predicted protein [Nematostella vectensis]
MASPDEAAALKRNVVHQTRLRLALRQLEKDKSVRIREMDKDTQVFMRRLDQINGIRTRASLPQLSEARRRATSAPARVATSAEQDEPSFVTRSATLQHRFEIRQKEGVKSPMSRTRNSPRETPRISTPCQTCSSTPGNLAVKKALKIPTIDFEHTTEKVNHHHKGVRFNLETSQTPRGRDTQMLAGSELRSDSPLIAQGTRLMKITNTQQHPTLSRRHTAPLRLNASPRSDN